MIPSFFPGSYDEHGRLVSSTLDNTRKHNLMCACFGFLSYKLDELIFVENIELSFSTYIDYPCLDIYTDNGIFELMFNFTMTELALIDSKTDDVVFKVSADNMSNVIDLLKDYYKATLVSQD